MHNVSLGELHLHKTELTLIFYSYCGRTHGEAPLKLREKVNIIASPSNLSQVTVVGCPDRDCSVPVIGL